MRRTTLVFWFSIIILAFFVHVAHVATIAEDAFITYRFAKNLALGHGLAWNVGEAPVEGYSNFLWVIFSAVALHAGLDVTSFTQGLGVGASLATLAYCYLYCRRLLKLDRNLSLLPCALLALSGPFATWAASGLETNLFALLTLSSSYHVASYWYHRRAVDLGSGFALTLVATLTRPEGLGVFCLLLGVHCLLALLQNERRELTRGVAAATALYVLPFSIYFIWRLGYYGYPLPNTFYAKTGGTLHQWIRGVEYVYWFFVHFGLPFAPLLVAFLWEKSGSRKATSGMPLLADRMVWLRNNYGFVTAAFVCSCYTTYVMLVGGDYMAMYRFMVPVLPLFYLVLTWTVKVLQVSTATEPKKSMLARLMLVVGMLVTALHSTPLGGRLFLDPGVTHGRYLGVLKERWHSDRLSLIGRFFNGYKKSPEESLATGAIGAVSYYSDLKIYGLHGIVEPYIAHQSREDLGKGFPGHEKGDMGFILSRRPTYFMYTRTLTEGPCAYPDDDLDNFAPYFRKDYELVGRWLEDEENGERGCFCFLQIGTEARKSTSDQCDNLRSG